MNKHRTTIEPDELESKCAQLNGYREFTDMNCKNASCPFYYMDQCPFRVPHKLGITIKISAEGTRLI